MLNNESLTCQPPGGWTPHTDVECVYVIECVYVVESVSVVESVYVVRGRGVYST